MKLEIKNVYKSFSGKEILKDVSFTVEAGKAMGFLGRNGAGKTTTIRALMDVFKADQGSFIYNGSPLDLNKTKVGYLPEERGMYQKVSTLDQLIYFGQLKGMTKKEAKERAIDCLDKMGLKEYQNKNLETLSKGNQQKVQIIQAIINDPDIVVFDEPFSGLDPVNSKILKDLIKDFINRGKIVIFSSHQMSYVEDICDDVTFIKNGRVIMTGDLENFKIEKGKNRFILDSKEREQLRTTLLDNINILSVKEIKSGLIVEIESLYKPNDILSSLISKNIELTKFEYYKPSLEEIFIELDGEVIDE